jgi:hypothetical protein
MFLRAVLETVSFTVTGVAIEPSRFLPLVEVPPFDIIGKERHQNSREPRITLMENGRIWGLVQ